MPEQSRYNRVVIKISGESLTVPGEGGIDIASVRAVADEIAAVGRMGVEVGLVVGAGNLLRGRDFHGPEARKTIHRTTADYMGMLGTVINALALRDALESRGTGARVMSAIPVTGVCEPFDRSLAVEYLRDKRVVIFAGGTGSPFFTTDMCAALRAAEIDAQVLMKATKVDGVYDSDPVKNPAARKYDTLSYQDVIRNRLGVMDLTAITMCMETKTPILVFQLSRPGSLTKALSGEKVGTLISD